MAGDFLDRIYTNAFSSLPVGKARYGLMRREDGFVMDDGTTSRLAEDRFLMTTTTANAARVFQHMQFCRQVLWPELDVQFVSVTDQWAQYSLAGPRARDVLSALVDPGSVGLLVGTGTGRVCLVVGLLLEAVAALWMRRILASAEAR